MKTLVRNFFVLLALTSLTASCNKTPGGGGGDASMDSVSYQASDAIIANPERGFYIASEVSKVSTTGVSKDGMASARLRGRTLYLLEFHMKEYVNSDISDDYLQTIRTKFASLREGGCKCILRFCYSNGFAESDKPWDATPERVLRHIAQVKPLIREFADIILVVQAGFIGSWGEWYYTENFKDKASRKSVVDALLEAVPADRQIELRTPEYKLSLYGLSPADTITRATAHQSGTKERLGGHNDCYLASPNDQGTYRGNSDRTYWASESAYTIMGGETCGVSAYCHCEPQESPSAAHGVLADMAINHFTYLNSGYHTGVLSRWRTEGCFDEIEKRLGYRYVLESGQFTKAPKAGESMKVRLEIRNDGFAPVMNQRDAELVLTDASGKVLGTWALNSDPRFWMPGNKTVVEQSIQLPSGISGALTLHLNLPDHYESLHNNPLYSIQLANTGTWDEKTGYNKLYSFTL